jgi:hypothetical protein
MRIAWAAAVLAAWTSVVAELLVAGAELLVAGAVVSARAAEAIFAMVFAVVDAASLR